MSTWASDRMSISRPSGCDPGVSWPEPSAEAPDKVQFGVSVVLSDSDTGEEVRYTLVGEDEADPKLGLLSFNSPVARALINKEVDDTVTVRVPKGDREFEILEIGFDESPE